MLVVYVQVEWLWCQNFGQVELKFKPNLAHVNLFRQGCFALEFRQACPCHVYIPES